MYTRRLPVYLLVDCSESMAGEAIDAVSNGIRTLLDQLQRSPQALETVHLSVIAFHRTASQEVPLTELLQFRPPRLKVRPGTALGAALTLLQGCLEREVIHNTATTRGDFRPIVFLMTDGQPTDDWRVALERFKASKVYRQIHFYAIGCGPDVDVEVLRQVAGRVFLMELLSPEEISRLFVWLSMSMQLASTRVEATADERLALADLPPGLLKQIQTGLEGSELPGSSRRDGPAWQVFVHARCSRDRRPYLMRFALRAGTTVYDPVKSHRLEEEEAQGIGDVLPPIRSRDLNGNPPCPYCENTCTVLCDCGTLFCYPEAGLESVICPGCRQCITRIEHRDFDIKRTQG